MKNYKSTLVPIAIKDESVRRETTFLVACIPFTFFVTQFAQISTNVLPIRVWLMKIVLMDWTCMLVPALLVLLGLRAQVSYQVKADYHTNTYYIKPIALFHHDIKDTMSFMLLISIKFISRFASPLNQQWKVTMLI